MFLRGNLCGMSKLSLCSAFDSRFYLLQSPGIIDPAEFKVRRKGLTPVAHCLLEELRRRCNEAKCSLGVITDESTSIVYDQKDLDREPSYVRVLPIPLREYS